MKTFEIEILQMNMTFPNCLSSLLQSDASSKRFHTRFHLRVTTTHFHSNGIARGLAMRKMRYYFLGGYIYVEASLHTIGEKTRLISGHMTGTQCLSFKYHMMGPGTGTLIINQLSKTNPVPRVIWSRIGDQGEDWKEARFNLFGNSYRVR